MLINRHKEGEVHMRASWIFSKNDVIANLGVIAGGLLVWLLDSRWPDLLIGSLIALVILNGARLIIIDARSELSKNGLSQDKSLSSHCNEDTRNSTRNGRS
jgi:Co/Zn/Cd efflux system component